MFGKSKEASYGTETKAKIGTIIGEGAVLDRKSVVRERV